jgi:DNA-directed RNA polymerase sigma subunit (sigma70/sigma32)
MSYTKKADRDNAQDRIAAALGVSKQRAGQIERNAIAKCAKWCRRNNIDPEDLLLERDAKESNWQQIMERAFARGH